MPGHPDWCCVEQPASSTAVDAVARRTEAVADAWTRVNLSRCCVGQLGTKVLNVTPARRPIKPIRNVAVVRSSPALPLQGPRVDAVGFEPEEWRIEDDLDPPAPDTTGEDSGSATPGRRRRPIGAASKLGRFTTDGSASTLFGWSPTPRTAVHVVGQLGRQPSKGWSRRRRQLKVETALGPRWRRSIPRPCQRRTARRSVQSTIERFHPSR